MRSSAVCRYIAGISLYNAHIDTIKGSSLRTVASGNCGVLRFLRRLTGVFVIRRVLFSSEY